MAEKTNSNLKSRELRVITSNASRDKAGAGFKFRVTQYYRPASGDKAAQNISVKLESGEYWTGDDGIVRFKAKGLTLRDLEELEKIDATTGKAVYLTVKSLMKSPPPIPADEPEQGPDKEPESEVPFS